MNDRDKKVAAELFSTIPASIMYALTDQVPPNEVQDYVNHIAEFFAAERERWGKQVGEVFRVELQAMREQSEVDLRGILHRINPIVAAALKEKG